MAWSVVGNLEGPQGEPGPAVDLDIGTVTTGSPSSATIEGQPPNQVLNLVLEQGPPGEDGTGIAIAGSVPNYGALPDNLTQADAGDAYLNQADGKLYIWDGNSFPPQGEGAQFRGPQGPPGPANSLSIGTVSTGAPSDAKITGTPPNQVLSLTLERGPQGETGPPNSLSIGTVSTGSPSSATITGTAPSQTLNLTLEKGPPGTDGQDGQRGSNWYTGSGAPSGISGTLPGDLYLDTTTGDVYKLS